MKKKELVVNFALRVQGKRGTYLPRNKQLPRNKATKVNLYRFRAKSYIAVRSNQG